MSFVVEMLERVPLLNVCLSGIDVSEAMWCLLAVESWLVSANFHLIVRLLKTVFRVWPYVRCGDSAAAITKCCFQRSSYGNQPVVSEVSLKLVIS